jgi:hypothetical protein
VSFLMMMGSLMALPSFFIGSPRGTLRSLVP